MENMEDVIRIALKDDFATSLDLKSAFNHLIVNSELRPYLAFAFRGKSYCYRAMPFGAKHAPRLFTKALSFAIRFARINWDLRIVAYMDDILLLHQDPVYLQTATLQLAIFLEQLGWTINREKSEFFPKRQITFLGWNIDFQSLSLSMTPDTRTSSLKLLKEWIPRAYSGSSVPTRSFASLIGSLQSLRAQLPRAGLYLRALHTNLTQGVHSSGWNGKVTLNRRIISELLWWSRNIVYNTPYIFEYRPSQACLTTDASGEGFGAWLRIGHLSFTTSGFFPPHNSYTSSNQRETAAVLLSLSQFLPTLQAEQIRSMLIQSDNMVTVCNLARQSATETLLKLTREIFSLLTKADIRIQAAHIPGINNIVTDSLSRLDLAGDYELQQAIFASATASLHLSPSVDCFATALNHKCPRFFAPSPDQLSLGAAAIDGLAQPWASERLPYLHPPIALIPRVLQKILSEKVTVVMVIPFWPTHSWWNTLAPLIRQQINLGPAEKVLLRGSSMNSKLHKLPPGDLLMCLLSSSQ